MAFRIGQGVVEFGSVSGAFRKGLAGVRAAMRRMGRIALGMGKLIAAGAVVGAAGLAVLAVAAKKTLKAYMVQEDAENKLRAAMRLTGVTSKAALKDHKKFASALQKITTIGDETTLALMAMAAGMAPLSGKALQDATKAAIGLSKAYAIELVAAMRLVARAAVGDTSQLKRYGIVVDEALSVQEKFNAVVKIGIRNFKLAEAETETLRGTIKQTTDVIGDLTEQIGEKLAPTVKRFAKELRAALLDIGPQVTSYVQNMIVPVIRVLKTNWRMFADWLIAEVKWLVATIGDQVKFGAISWVQKILVGLDILLSRATGKSAEQVRKNFEKWKKHWQRPIDPSAWTKHLRARADEMRDIMTQAVDTMKARMEFEDLFSGMREAAMEAMRPFQEWWQKITAGKKAAIGAKDKKELLPAFVGLEQAWKQMQLSLVGAQSPQQQMATQLKQQTALQTQANKQQQQSNKTQEKMNEHLSIMANFAATSGVARFAPG